MYCGSDDDDIQYAALSDFYVHAETALVLELDGGLSEFFGVRNNFRFYYLIELSPCFDTGEHDASAERFTVEPRINVNSHRLSRADKAQFVSYCHIIFLSMINSGDPGNQALLLLI